jgi:hypothetical protein
MGEKIKDFGKRINKRFPVPLLLIGGVIILVLSLNEETSVTRNYQYMREIQELTKQIKINEDSAQYYHDKREALLNGNTDLEHIAREHYHMQRPTEDVYIVN